MKRGGGGILGGRDSYWDCRIKLFEKGCIPLSCEGGVDSGSVAHIAVEKVYFLVGRGRLWEQTLRIVTKMEGRSCYIWG